MQIVNAKPVLQQAAAPAPNSPEKDKLRKATREMESYFVGTLLKKMHETASKGGLFDQKSETSTYREMLDDSIAAEIGKRGAFGIADALYKQLVVSLDLQKVGDAAAAVTAVRTPEVNPKKQDGEKNGR